MKKTTIIPGGVLAVLTGLTGLTATHAAKAVAHTYKGSVVDTRWGPVQATVTIKGKKITKVKVSEQAETFRSQEIVSNAAPLLRQEVLQAQSATVDEVSGATTLSDAFMQSLQSALKKAHFQSPQ